MLLMGERWIFIGILIMLMSCVSKEVRQSYGKYPYIAVITVLMWPIALVYWIVSMFKTDEPETPKGDKKED